MHTARALLCSCLTLAACVPAAAQTLQQPTRPERPYRGIFASGMDDSGQSLTATGTLSGGYDDNVLADATHRNSIRAGQGGALTQFSGGLAYALNGQRGTINSALGTSIRYYPSIQDNYYKAYNASLGGQLQLLRKPNWTAYQSVAYQPYTFLSALPESDDPAGASSIPEPDFIPIATQFIAYEGGSNYQQQLSARTTWSMLYSYRATDRNDRRFWRQTGGSSLSVGLNRYVSFRAGYRYTEGHYEGHLVQAHRPDVGIDFNRALSLTRRTSVTFGAGTEAVVVQGVTRFQATGNGQIQHEMGRSWLLAGRYERGTYYMDTLAEPAFGDSATLSLGGLLTRRIQFQANASATVGQAGFALNRNYDMYRGSMTISTALTRFMNVGVDYAYYRYSFDDQIVLDPGLPHDVKRQSIRAHVTLWAPLLNKMRRANASR
jgi:hypothetical protein